MSPAARSAAVFGAYLLVLAVVMLSMPGTFTDLGQLPEAPDLFVRVLGVLVMALGGYFSFAAKNDDRAFLAASVQVRFAVFIGFALIALTEGEPMLIVVGLVDVAFATWTWMALRSGSA